MLSIWTWVKSLFIKEQKQAQVIVPKPMGATKCNRHLRFIKNCPECRVVVYG